MADIEPNEIHLRKGSAKPVLSPIDRKKRRRKIIAALIAGKLMIAAGAYLFMDGDHVSTENAYVNADSAQVAPLVSGPVAEVFVVNTQAVRRGEILFRLDDAEAKLAVTKAEADLIKAQRQYRQTAATGSSLAAQVNARNADIGQAQAQLVAANANLAKAKIDLDRRQALADSGAISGEELTVAQNAYVQARANAGLASAAVNTALASRDAAGKSHAANQALIDGLSIDQSPEVAAAAARLAQARLDLERTVIRAPIDGVVTNRQVQVGQRLNAGSAAMTIVPVASVYVDANFKESQLAKVRKGQPVELTSDLYGSDVVFHGRVLGFSGGTGSAFSLIPAQNATGNWIKVVQRLPVRIALDSKELARHPLRVGLSMEVEVDVSAKAGRD